MTRPGFICTVHVYRFWTFLKFVSRTDLSNFIKQFIKIIQFVWQRLDLLHFVNCTVYYLFPLSSKTPLFKFQEFYTYYSTRNNFL